MVCKLISHFLTCTKTFGVCLVVFSSFSQAGVLSISVDNDGVMMTDKDYSSGLFFRWSEVQNQKGIGIEIGSQLWTPKDIEARTPQPNERPYAGLLYFKLNGFSQSPRKTTKLNMKLGKVGPNSNASKSQIILHDIIGSPKPNGWKYQIYNEQVYQFTIEEHVLMKRVGRNEWSIFARAQAGNFQPELAMGTTYRQGMRLDNTFGSTSFQKGNAIDPSLLNESSNGMFWYLSSEIRFRFKDLTLEGDMPDENYPVTPTHWQWGLATGVAFYQKTWGLTLSMVIEHKSFEQAQYQHHSYANLGYFYRY